MKKIDPAALPADDFCNYPPPFDAPCNPATTIRLGRAAGLKAFGVNLSRLPPGAWSSQRHWHTHEDEFVMVVEGEAVLVTDAGEEVLRARDCAAFKAGDPDGPPPDQPLGPRRRAAGNWQFGPRRRPLRLPRYRHDRRTRR
jgi:uncharacterized cupin superfamily protein